MDRRRLSAIAHDGRLLWNPLPAAATLALVDSLDVGPAARVIDVGCGRAELLIRLLARTGASGIGVDPWPHAMRLARAAAAGRVDPSRLELREEEFDATRFAEASFDAALFVGASGAAGGRVETLAALRRLVVPGGLALVGEGLWLREPDPDYLAAFGDGLVRDELCDHAGNLANARAAGFDVVESLVSSKEDWDAYTDSNRANVERFAAEHPGDPEAAAFLHETRARRAAYVRWGRDTMGFALYLLRRA